MKHIIQPLKSSLTICLRSFRQPRLAATSCTKKWRLQVFQEGRTLRSRFFLQTEANGIIPEFLVCRNNNQLQHKLLLEGDLPCLSAARGKTKSYWTPENESLHPGPGSSRLFHSNKEVRHSNFQQQPSDGSAGRAFYFIHSRHTSFSLQLLFLVSQSSF